jgi:vacuolar-type H+-ATPase subunit F/Vma7
MTSNEEPVNCGTAVKAYVIGREDVVTSFRMMGLEGSVVSSSSEVLPELERVAQGDVKIVILDVGLAKPVEGQITQFRRSHAVTVVDVPCPSSVEPMRDFNEFLAKALGIRL